MDPLDKLELIVKERIRERKAESQRGRGKHNPAYLQGLDSEIDALQWVWSKIDAIRRNAPAVSDEMIQRMYGKVEK